MKHKIFLIVLVCLFTLGTAVLADYIDPTGTPSSYSTPIPLKTYQSPVAIYESLGTWEWDPSKSSTIDNTRLNNFNTAMINSTYIGHPWNKSVTHAGSEDGRKGVFAEKLTSLGATVFGSSNTSADLVSMVDIASNFDQFLNQTNFYYPKNTTKTAKPFEVFIAGRLLGKIGLTDTANLSFNTNSNPNYSFDFLATNNSNFAPTTNIGLGNSCNLYPADLGLSVADGGGCPAGSYISYYKAPSFSGAITSSNNTNTQVVGTCVNFSPSASPTNTGHCSTSRPSAATVVWNVKSVDKCRITIPGHCDATSYYYKDTGYSGWVSYMGNLYDDCSYFPSGRTFAFSGTCYSGGIGSPAIEASASKVVDSYKYTSTISINNSVLKMPSTLNGNIKWYYGSGPTESTSDRDKTKADGATMDRVRVTDDYGQYIEVTK